MLGNSISFSVDVVDNVSRRLKYLTKTWERDVARVNRKGMSLGNFGGASLDKQLFGALGSAGIATGLGVITTGLTAAAGAAGYLGFALAKAASTETAVIAKSSDIAQNIGLSIEGARKSYEKIESQLAKDAAVLPGNTSDYGEVLNGMSMSLSKAYTGDQAGFEGAAADMSKRAGVLAAVNHADAGQAGSALNRAVLGTSGLGELRVNDVFQKTGLVERIDEELAAVGKTTEDWMVISTRERADLLQKALKKATPDEMIAAFEGTAEAILQGWKSSLFEPLNGIFGVRRKLASMGDRTALDGFTDFLTSVDRTVKRVQAAFGEAGFNFDPMVKVLQGLDWLSIKANDVYRWVEKLSSGGMFESFKNFDVMKIDGHTIGIRVGDWIYNTVVNFFKAQSGEKLAGSGMITQVIKQSLIAIATAISRLLDRAYGAITSYGANLRISLIEGAVALRSRVIAGMQQGVARLVDRIQSAIDSFGSMIQRGIQSVIPDWIPGGGGGVGRRATSGAMGILAKPLASARNAISNTLDLDIHGTNLGDPQSVVGAITGALNDLFHLGEQARL
jgi:hypothetical protein